MLSSALAFQLVKTWDFAKIIPPSQSQIKNLKWKSATQLPSYA